MGLKDYQPPTQSFEIAPGNTLSVRGLGAADLAAIAVKHAPTLTFIYKMFTEAKSGPAGFTPEVAGGLLVAVMQQFPEAVATMIALAADEPDEADSVGKLPLPLQAEITEAVIGLTFVSEAELKKLVETVTRMLERGRTTTVALSTPSGNGTGGFASK